MTELHLEKSFCLGHDGTRLAHYRCGISGARPLVISAGLGGGLTAWRPLLRHWQKRYQIHLWDYRGLYGSEASRCREGYSVASHAADLASLLRHLDIDASSGAIFMGWSMGVQVSLELFREHSPLAAAFVALHGTSGFPLQTAFDSAWTERVSPYVFRGMRRYWRRVAPFLPAVAGVDPVVDFFMEVCRRIGFMDRAMDRSVFQAMAREWVTLDLGAYADIFEYLGQHDASDVAADLDAPTLVVAGEQDSFTPAYLAEQMVQELPHGELFMLADATHFGLMEYPEAIAQRVDSFLEHHLSS